MCVHACIGQEDNLRLSLNSPGFPGTRSMDQAGLKLLETACLPASASLVLELTSWPITLPTPNLHCVCVVLF